MLSVYPIPSSWLREYMALSYYHHQIGSMNYYPLFRVRSWNNDVRCMFLYILTGTKCWFRMNVHKAWPLGKSNCKMSRRGQWYFVEIFVGNPPGLNFWFIFCDVHFLFPWVYKSSDTVLIGLRHGLISKNNCHQINHVSNWLLAAPVHNRNDQKAVLRKYWT